MLGTVTGLRDRLSRRDWLRRAACGFGGVALAGLLADDAAAGAAGAPASPLLPHAPHFPPRARRVIFLFMPGGVSHVDTFDPKPELARRHGQPLPLPKPKFEFAPTGNLLKSPWQFRKWGESGTEISELFPRLAECVDD